jgi:hypothetical protein
MGDEAKQTLGFLLGGRRPREDEVSHLPTEARIPLYNGRSGA